MAKQAGFADQLFVAGVDLSGDVGAITRIGAPSEVLDVTAINAEGHERIHTRFDGEINFNSFWNKAAGQQHLSLSPKVSTDQIVTYFHGSTIGNAAAGLTAKQINYDPTRTADGGLTMASQFLANATGLDYCEMLTAGKRTDGAATNGASFQAIEAGATAFGLAVYLQVFAFTGTSVTVKVQQSSDDGGGDAFADLITFTAATGVTFERKGTAALTTSVEEYLRVVTTGTFSNAIFAVCATRYPVVV